jgi:hypothetical protein
VDGLSAPLPGALLLDGRPTFRWPAVKGALRYTLRFSEDQGSDSPLEWQEPTRETTLPWPKKRPALPAGALGYWDVVAHLPNSKEVAVVTDCKLRVATAHQRKPLDELADLARSRDGDSRLLAAVLLEEWRAYDLALAVYQDLARKRPEPSVGVLLALHRLHRRGGDRAGAEEIRKRLVKRGLKFEAN